MLLISPNVIVIDYFIMLDFNLSLSDRSNNFRPSQTLAITAKAKQMIADGIPVVSMAAGEPDFNTPEVICVAAKNSIDSGFTKYTPTSGTPLLKKAIVNKLKRDNNLDYSPESIVVSCGAKHSLYNTFQAIINPGDEVLLFTPYWTSYFEQIILAGGVPVSVPTSIEHGFVPSAEDVTRCITNKTKCIVINSPNNPTGAVYPEKLLREIAEIAKNYNLWMISDEIYEKLIYGDDAHFSVASLSEDAANRTITINGCSKAYSMTGWRIGYSASHPDVAKKISNFQDQVTSNPTSFAQQGAIAALEMDDAVLHPYVEKFAKRRDLIYQGVSNLPEVICSYPGGAFYLLADFSYWMNKLNLSDIEFASKLLEEYRLAVIPGSIFGDSRHLRFSYATSEEKIEQSLEILNKFISDNS